MAVVTTVSNHAAYMLGTKKIDFANDTFVAVLMNTTFAFDKTSDATLSDVTSDQIATGNGYTQDSKNLSGVSVTEDDTDGGIVVTWDDVSWTASGGTIGAAGACIIYDDTTTDDTILMCIDFGADVSAVDGINFVVQDVEFNGLTA